MSSMLLMQIFGDQNLSSWDVKNVVSHYEFGRLGTVGNIIEP